MMIGGEAGTVKRLDPIFKTLAPGIGNIPRTPGRERLDGTAENGYPHCGPSGAGHFVKMVHNGIEYGAMAACVLPNYLRDLYRSFGVTLDRFHDESEYRLPMPARYVIDRCGIIREADVNADYTIRPEAAETLQTLRGLSAST